MSDDLKKKIKRLPTMLHQEICLNLLERVEALELVKGIVEKPKKKIEIAESK